MTLISDMKNLSVLAFLAVIVLCFSSCSPKLTPFTQDLYQENKWTENELSQIQFYLSEDIMLFRQIGTDTTEIVEGEINIINGKEVEEIVIPKGTPGVFLFSPSANQLAISFESEGEERFLMFGPNPNASNRFTLLAKAWGRENGVVRYDGKEYEVSFTDAFASLLVDLKRASKNDMDSRKAVGRKISK